MLIVDVLIYLTFTCYRCSPSLAFPCCSVLKAIYAKLWVFLTLTYDTCHSYLVIDTALPVISLVLMKNMPRCLSILQRIFLVVMVSILFNIVVNAVIERRLLVDTYHLLSAFRDFIRYFKYSSLACL